MHSWLTITNINPLSLSLVVVISDYQKNKKFNETNFIITILQRDSRIHLNSNSNKIVRNIWKQKKLDERTKLKHKLLTLNLN